MWRKWRVKLVLYLCVFMNSSPLIMSSSSSFQNHYLSISDWFLNTTKSTFWFDGTPVPCCSILSSALISGWDSEWSLPAWCWPLTPPPPSLSVRWWRRWSGWRGGTAPLVSAEHRGTRPVHKHRVTTSRSHLKDRTQEGHIEDRSKVSVCVVFWETRWQAKTGC